MNDLEVLLLVEDDDNDIIITQRKIIKTQLKIGNLLIIKNLAETINIIESRKIDMMLLDLNLPDSKGVDTIKSVRKVYVGIIIVLTSLDDELIGIQSIREGADEYIVKSKINEESLRRIILFAIEKRQRKERHAAIEWKIKKMQDILSSVSIESD